MEAESPTSGDPIGSVSGEALIADDIMAEAHVTVRDNITRQEASEQFKDHV